MKIEQWAWTRKEGWAGAGAREPKAEVVLAFGARSCLEDAGRWAELRELWPRATLVGCSTAGEIADTVVRDESIVATALLFERSRAAVARVRISDTSGSFSAGRALAEQLQPDELCHVFVLSEGLRVNGSDLVSGLAAALPPDVVVTGGLSADGSRFEHTCVSVDSPPTGEGVVAALGLYGSRLRVGFGSLGGWDPFGPERVVTRARGAVLYELDGQPALELYKRYLGEHAAELPASGLLFPLAVRQNDHPGVVRTLLSIDERQQSVTFAGDIPLGARARLMHANFERLVDGAYGAACGSRRALRGRTPELALLVSCVGRKLVLQQRVEEEVEAVRDVLGQGAVLAGFYSYGEISPFAPTAPCELHNQTMTITTLLEE